MSVAEFLNEFIPSPVPVEVNVFISKEKSKDKCSGIMTYIGCETNWDAFMKHLSGFNDVDVNDISVEDGKLIINGIL